MQDAGGGVETRGSRPVDERNAVARRNKLSQVTEFSPASEADRSQSRTVSALLAIRELILEGVLAPGRRISELSVAERTGISRTPIRAALQRLEEEGLIETIPSGGFAVKSFSQQDVFDAIEVRATRAGRITVLPHELKLLAPRRALPADIARGS